MRILYIGNSDKHGYSYYQYKIIKKVYKKVFFLEIQKLNIITNLIFKICWHFNTSFFDYIIKNSIKKKINIKFDIIYIHNESLIGKKTINLLKSHCKKIIFYCPDNPFLDRDNQRWKLLLPNLKMFDLIIFMAKNRLKHAKKFNLKNIIWIPPTFKIKEQERRKINSLEKKKYETDVLMIATWFPERGDLFLKLIQNNINFKIYGGRWHKFKHYRKYKKYIGNKIESDELYVKLIQSSKINICLPSLGNNDDITNRSIEIPYIGSMLLAKKTKTHEELFKNYKEAVFFNNYDDCVKKIKLLLSNDQLRKKITKNGYEKNQKMKKKLSFEYNVKKIINGLNLD